MPENFLIRKRAWALLRGNWGTAILIFIVNIAINIASSLTDTLFSNDSTMGVDGLLAFIISILLIPIGVGIKWTFLSLVRGEKFEIGGIFEPYKILFGKSILASILQGLLILAWSLPVIILGIVGFIALAVGNIDTALDGDFLDIAGQMILFIFIYLVLLMVPVIIKGISYAQTMYILKDAPETSSIEAITMSKRMMVGHKWDYFTLNLSFIGWGILCLLSLGVGFLWLVPYIQTSQAEFYNQLNEKNNGTNEIILEDQTPIDSTIDPIVNE